MASQYGQDQAESNLEYWQGLRGQMRKPTALASPEEKRAYTAERVRSGDLPAYELPEQYGGMPAGTTRRAIRAQQAWVAQQNYIAALAQQQREMQQADREERKLSIAENIEQRQQAQQDLEIKKQQILMDREKRIQDEAGVIFDSISGKMGPDGKWISAPITPEDDRSIERLQDLAKLKYGMENKPAQEMWSTLYNDAMKFREDKLNRVQKQSEQQQSWLVGQQEEAASVGVDTSKFFTTKVDPETNQTVVTAVDQLGLSKAIGEAKRQDAERKKQEIASASVSEEIRGEAKDALKGIEEIDKQIREQNFMASRESGERARDEYLARAEYLRGEREVLTARFNNLIPKKQESVQPKTEVAQPQQKELSQQDQVALNWANANPDDPRSQKIKAKLGVQ